MAITLIYKCSCGYSSGHLQQDKSDKRKTVGGMLQDAQAHADRTGHTVQVHGEMSPQEKTGVLRQLEISQERKLREQEIMRLAKEKGLLPNSKDHVVKEKRSDLGIISDEILRGAK